VSREIAWDDSEPLLGSVGDDTLAGPDLHPERGPRRKSWVYCPCVVLSLGGGNCVPEREATTDCEYCGGTGRLT
jgi:hypothetical protein